MGDFFGTSAGGLLAGTENSDVIITSIGDDTINAGGGDDIVADSGGIQTVISGGAGNDRIAENNFALSSFASHYLTTTLLDAGDGNDIVTFNSSRLGSASIALGAGDDALIMDRGDYLLTTTVSLGTGQDLVQLGFELGDTLRHNLFFVPPVITDFTVGVGGDLINLGEALRGLFNNPSPLTVFPATNPFASGHIRLVQNSVDTVLRLDIDGVGPGSGPIYTRDILRLSHVTATQLTADNFAGWAPDGGAPLAHSASGTAGDDVILAGVTDTNLTGLGGNDVLMGSVGNDTFEGGSGNDSLTGGSGDDTLLGGLGTDSLEGGTGNDLLSGGDGNDVIVDAIGNDTIIGGDGDDQISLLRAPDIGTSTPRSDTVVIDAGDGNDRVSIADYNYNVQNYRTILVNATVDLGTGDDIVSFVNCWGTFTLTLGAGHDRVEMNGWGPGHVITDFAPGDGGDQLDLGRVLLLSAGADLGSNPFTSGYLQLRQVGADTHVLWDQDGAGGSDATEELVTLQGISVASLTAYNFTGYAPDRSPLQGETYTGTLSADTRYGSSGADHINSHDGADQLWGGFGNDTIDSGAGNDTIEGGFGDDVLIGGAGDDLLSDTAQGSDTLSGGDGNDTIIISRDYVNVPEILAVDSGIGDDALSVRISDPGGRTATLAANMGAGNDRVSLFSFQAGGTILTLGTGVDKVIFDESLISQVKGPVTITDFQTGLGGDVLDWVAYMNGYSRTDPFVLIYPETGADAYNPFQTGQAQLIQSGADTLLQMSHGPASTQFDTIVAFQNTSVSAFTADNLGIDPAQDTAPSTAGNDSFAGTAAIDVVRGGDGNDQLSGQSGDDLLVGGAGNDTLDGGAGNDVLYGGNGNDTISGGNGNDTIDGGAGGGRIHGGVGNDRIDSSGLETITAGDGNDRVFLSFPYYQTVIDGGRALGSLDTGNGYDLVVVRNSGDASQAGGYTINLGADNDTIYTDGNTGALMLGAGSDRVVVSGDGIVISDFQTGDGGDIYDFSSFANMSFGATDPFGTGHAQIAQDGNDVVFTYDDSFRTFFSTFGTRFLNTIVSDFTTFNFAGFDPSLQVSLTHSTHITVSRTIAPATTLTIHNPVEGIGINYDSSAGTAKFVNHGTVAIDNTGPDARGALTGFANTTNNMDTTEASFFNTPDGRFTVISDLSTATGFSGLALPFRNEGHFELTAGSGADNPLFSKVVGVEMEPHSSQQSTFYNSGTMLVSGGWETYGVKLAPFYRFDNSGTIAVSGTDFAVGVYMRGLNSQEFNNSGTISVVTPPTATYSSIGLAFQSQSPSPPTIVNSGRIIADVAIFALDLSPLGHPETLNNSGEIDGAVMLADGNDVVLNSGSMYGRTLLGNGNDRYDGSSGLHYGSVEGGNGNDTLIGGAGDDNLFGDAQDDVIIGGSGYDYIEGGQGNDLLDGGDGIDMVSYLGSPLAIVASLATGTMTTSQEVDYVRNFEQIVGSRSNDIFIGSARDEAIAGYRGNDTIDGGAGNDELLGGQGNDLLTGGSGNDSFLFETGDGQDEIIDFGAGDTIRIFGYTSYEALQQQGTDVWIVLSADDRILVRGASAASFTISNLQFSTGPTGIVIPDIPDETFRPDQNVVIGPSSVFGLTDTQPIRIRYSTIQSTAIALEAPVGLDGLGVWNAGTVRFNTSDAVPYSALVASSIANGYGGRNHWLVNEPGGTLELNAANAKAYGTYGINAVWNFGTIAVASHSGDASAVAGLFSTFVNVGAITVDAAGIGRGVDRAGNSSSVTLMVNSGQITVHGAAASIGIENFMSAHPLAEQPKLVNSGTITVTDGTADLDSAGLSINVAANGTIWNTGTITADYAIQVIHGSSYNSFTPYNFAVYNSGTLDGLVQLSSYDDVLVNTGTTNGDMDMGGGNDIYDGRHGLLTGKLEGNAGNDMLLAGSSSQTILGGFGDDTLSGGAGNDTLTGGAGVDIFRIGIGFDHDVISDFDKGSAHDFIDTSGYSAYQSIVQQGDDVLITFSAADSLLVHNVVVADLTGGTIRFGATDIAPYAIPAAPVGAVPPAQPTASTDANVTFTPVIGTAEADMLTGGSGPDDLRGLAGNDRLDGGTGPDRMAGGTGDELYLVDNVGDVVLENSGEGTDRVIVALASYILPDNVEKITFATAGAQGSGNALDNELVSGGGATSLAGLNGNDSLTGAAGSDTLLGGIGNDMLTGGPGTDRLSGGADTDLFIDTAAGFSGDTITDLALGERIRISDASLGGFAFALNGTVLTFTGGTLTLGNLPTGYHLEATAAPSGGVDLGLVQDSHQPASTGLRRDFNGDARDDILWRSDGGALSNWLGTVSGGFAVNDGNAFAQVSNDWQVAGAGDFNGDGRNDILWRSNGGALSDWLGQADGGFVVNDVNAFSQVSTDWQVAVVGDFNGDGRDDLLWRSSGGAMSDWLGQANGGFAVNDRNAFTFVPTSWHVVAVGDFNGDGHDDILWRSDSGALSDWLGQANGGFIGNDGNAFVQIPTNWHVVGTGDFNGDGRDDILWRSDSGALSDWLGQANGGFIGNDGNAFVQVPTTWQVVGTGDYNGDGRDDILWRSDSGALSDWLGQANGGFIGNDGNAFSQVSTAWHVQASGFVLI